MFARRQLAMLTGSVVAAMMLGGCQGTVPGLQPSPTPVPGAWSCPGGDLLMESPSEARASVETLLTVYAETCRNKARIINESTDSEHATTSLINGLVNLAVTDLPSLPEADREQALRRCSQSPLVNLPVLVSPIALQYNVPGVEGLKLNPRVLAQIFTGSIDTWDDAEIAELNPDADLPDEEINVFFRSGSNGTTEAMNSWLSATAPGMWPANDATSTWRGKGEAKNSADEIGNSLRSTTYSIGYVDVASVARKPAEAKLPYAQIDNGRGPVSLSSSAVRKALEGATVAPGNDVVVTQQYNDLGPDAYPINKVTYLQTCSKGQQPDRTAVLTELATFAVAEPTQDVLAATGTVPLPPQVRERTAQAAAAIE